MALRDHLDEVEPTAVIAVGFLLFIVPEPATSTAGIGLMLLGIAWWIQEWD
jgi:hypothetical protein